MRQSTTTNIYHSANRQHGRRTTTVARLKKAATLPPCPCGWLATTTKGGRVYWCPDTYTVAAVCGPLLQTLIIDSFVKPQRFKDFMREHLGYSGLLKQPEASAVA